MITIQADGEIPTRVHERIAVKLNPSTCHLFDAGGAAVERAQRHPGRHEAADRAQGG